MMEFYLPEPESGSDYQSIRRNGMCYQHWQGGYLDILKKGHPQPEDQETILADLYSPQTDDFLHGGSEAVPYLISERVLEVFQKSKFTGYRLAGVDVTKISTKGKRNRKASSGEPEDAILSRRDVKGEVRVPTLYAVYITGRIHAIPDFPSGWSPSGYVSPFDLRPASRGVPDLFQPELDGEPFSAWVFCSEHFRNVVTESGLTNISFQSFKEFMMNFRNEAIK